MSLYLSAVSIALNNRRLTDTPNQTQQSIVVVVTVVVTQSTLAGDFQTLLHSTL